MWTHQPTWDWIDTVCRQYSRIMGRALTFDSHAAEVRSGAIRDTGDALEQWRVTIRDGAQTVGVLRLRSRSGQERDAEFLKACETAELTAQLIERVIATRGGDDLVRPAPPRGASTDNDRPLATKTASKLLDPLQVAARMDRLLDALRRLTDYPAAALLVRDSGTGEWNWGAMRGSSVIDLSPESLAECAESLRTDQEDRIAVFRQSVQPFSTETFLPTNAATGIRQCLGDARSPLGALWLFDRRDRRLTHRDRHALGLAAQRLEQLLSQAKLLDDSSNGRLLKAEVRIASRTQPSSPIEYTGRQGWCEMAGCTQTARGIGGDLFELIPLADDRVFLAIGDAAGHSIPAAMVMANVRGALRALFDSTPHVASLPTGRPPHEVLRCVNSVLHSIVQSHQFMTMFCGILD
ncbi:MAG: SpoIIE family protein phosphatase, partial [Planctomycetaceae bacterium]|nr:SpoIIE family protein phosphatase [Planctomycetaceae bacterium]